MNLLPRALALALLIVLVALAALLAVQRPGNASVTPKDSALAPARSAVSTARVAEATRRIALGLALTGAALTLALVASLAVRRPRLGESRPPFQTARSEIGTLAKLAETSNAQSVALAHERDVRQRAEADALSKEQLLNRSLEEKIRLGRDLHDGIIQSLYAAGLTIESARAVAKADPGEADRRLARCLESLNRCIRDIRAHITELAAPSAAEASFTQSLDILIAEFEAAGDTQFELRIDDEAAARLAPPQSRELVQVTREAISNAVRHGGATHVAIHLQNVPNASAVEFIVQDNGRGFAPAQTATGGHGLNNMRARARQLGGELHLSSAPGTGTRVALSLPVAVASA